MGSGKEIWLHGC